MPLTDGGATDSALSAEEFERLMARLAPFERAPRLAVGVSGGADSMALCLLAHVWAKAQGGEATALIVDHGLRAESAREAAQVGRWLADRGIPHCVLAWTGAKPARNVQAEARRVRHALLEEWCRNRGVPHLLLAHHREDQAETVILRLARGSGVDGLAAMAPERFARGLRVLRPLLTVSGPRLRATLQRFGQAWIEDPSNDNPAFARVRARRLLEEIGQNQDLRGRIAETAQRLSRARAALDEAARDILVRAAALFPAGYCRLDPTPFASAPEDVRLRALSRILMTVGGRIYPPRLASLEALAASLDADEFMGGRTLQGCRILPASGGRRSARFRLLVVREAALATETLTLACGDAVLWDNRFRVARAGEQGLAQSVRRLGRDGLTLARRFAPKLGEDVPAPARPSLPSLWDDRGPLAIPHLGFTRPGAERVAAGFSAIFTPLRPLSD